MLRKTKLWISRLLDERVKNRVDNLEEIIDFLLYENSRLSETVRELKAQSIDRFADAPQTRDSFDFQWEKLPTGRYNLDNPEFREEAAAYVCQFTGMTPEWFAGKKVVDVGCGAGRYSWAMCTMGAEVLSLDHSKHGLKRARDACQEFPSHRTEQIDLTGPLSIDETFDLVWCYGVLHHTGDTRGGVRTYRAAGEKRRAFILNDLRRAAARTRARLSCDQ